MKRTLPGLLSAFLLVLMTAGSLRSQDLDVGIMAGGCYYLGDLNPGKHFLNTRPAYGVLVRYTLDTRWAVKVGFSRGEIRGNAGQSTFLPERGMAFQSPVTDISGVVEFNFLSYFTGSRFSTISPYIYTGISAFFFDPLYNGTSLRAMGTEGQNIGYEGRSPYGSVSVSVPFGLGGKFSLGKRIGIQVYWEMHKTFNDYLDDVSTTYYLDGRTIDADDQAGILSDPTRNHMPGMQRGNESNKDWFAFFGVAVTYKFDLLASRKCREMDK